MLHVVEDVLVGHCIELHMCCNQFLQGLLEIIKQKSK